MSPVDVRPPNITAPDITAPDISPATAVRRLARHSPDRIALLYGGESISYAELAGTAGQLAAVLAEGGLRRGDRVAYLGLNSPAFLLTYLAAAWLGAVFVPVNSRLAAGEVGQILGDCAACALVVEPGHRATAEPAAYPGAVLLRLLVDNDPAVPVVGEPGPHWVRLSAALAGAGTPADPVPCHEQDLAALAYTSGTTGRPKGVSLSHGNLYWNGANLDTAAGTVADDTNLVIAPLFHTAPLGCFTLRNLLRGGRTVLRRSFDAGQTLADLVEHRVNTFFAVPAMYTAIARVPGFADADLSGLRCAVAAGAPATPPLIAHYADHGVLLQQAYGLTETLFATCLPAAQTKAKIGSAGVPLPFTEIRLIEQGTGRELTQPGVRGEVCLRGPNVSAGYWHNAEATAAAFDIDGWFHTGDVGYLDEQGCLYLVDRLKDVIIVGGDNVYSAEVERVLADFPGVLDVAVVGTPDQTWGEAVVAVLSCQDGVVPSLPQLRRFAGPHLAAYKLPTRMALVESLPRNVMGKIDKNVIRASLASAGPTAATALAGPVTTDPSGSSTESRSDVASAPEPAVGSPEASDPLPPVTQQEPEWARRFTAASAKKHYGLALELVTSHVWAMLEQAAPAVIAAEDAFDDLGLGSLAAVELANRLNADTGLRLPTTLLFDYPTIGALAQHLCAQLAPEPTAGDNTSVLARLNELEAALAAGTPDGQLSKHIVTRLRRILAELTFAEGATSGAATADQLDAASDDELFDLIDTQFGPA